MNLQEVLEQRLTFLQKANKSPELQAVEIELCKNNILHLFRNHLYTDKNTNLYTGDEPAIIPFIPYEFQEELITEVWSSIMNGTRALDKRDDLTNVFIEKSRQMGISWLIMAIFVYGFIFHNHKYHVISQKETDVDKIGDIRSLLEKARFIMANLPQWMLPKGYTRNTGTEYNKYMSLTRGDGTGGITGESANPNASRSGTYNAIFMDEMAFMSNATTINTAAASATPCRIFNSTPNGEGNEFYRMRQLTVVRKGPNGENIQPEIKGLRYHWSDHPLYTKEWFEWKTQGMTREKIAQELEIDYNTAIVGRVYPEFPKKPVIVEYNSEKPLYIGIDNSHGGTDPHAIICAQLEDHYINVIDAIELSCTPQEAAEFLSGQPRFIMTTAQQQFLERYKKYNWRKGLFISDPYDTKVAMGNSTILDDYKKVGINLFMPDERDKVEQIMKTRTNLYRVRYNDNCLDFASALLNARYPEVKEDTNRTTSNQKPVHNRTSHYRTALEYLITYILENPVVEKQRILIDTRPMRNYVTGELIYKR